MSEGKTLAGEHIPISHFAAKGSYAIDDHNEQVTVLGTMGQDPNEKKPISWRTWAIVAITTLAVFQNTFIGSELLRAIHTEIVLTQVDASGLHLPQTLTRLRARSAGIRFASGLCRLSVQEITVFIICILTLPPPSSKASLPS